MTDHFVDWFLMKLPDTVKDEMRRFLKDRQAELSTMTYQLISLSFQNPARLIAHENGLLKYQ